MRRVLFACLAIVMLWSSTGRASMHVHAYTGHDHVDHHHGPATHDHDRHAPANGDGERFPSCDPGAHAIFLASATTTVPTAAVFSVPFDSVELYAVAPECACCGPVYAIDVRQHSPPRCTPQSPRAPPSFTA